MHEQAVRPTSTTDYVVPTAITTGIYAIQVNSPEAGVTGSELIRKL